MMTPFRSPSQLSTLSIVVSLKKRLENGRELPLSRDLRFSLDATGTTSFFVSSPRGRIQGPECEGLVIDFWP